MSSLFTADVLRDDADRLEQTGPWGDLYSVRAWTYGGRLYWRAEGHSAPSGNDDMLRNFLSLADAGDARIASYANRWGVLHVCQHGRPASHNPPPVNLGGYSGWDYWCDHMGRYDRLPDADGYEPLEVWRRLSAEAGALARVAAALREGRPGAAADWAIIYANSGQVAPWWKPSRDGDSIILARVVSEWLSMTNVRPRLRVRRIGPGGGYIDGLDVEYAGRGLFGALTMQLALVVSGSRGLYSCAGCPSWFMVPRGKRKPQAGRGAYCPACRLANVPQRRANERRTRARS